MQTRGRVRVILTLFLIQSLSPVNGQSDSVSIYIERLSWNSIDIFYSYAPKVSLVNEGEKILHFEDSNKATKLINALSSPQKTVAAHLALSLLIDTSKYQFSIGGLYEQDKVVGSIFRFNGLEWKKLFDGRFSIKKEDIRTIKKYWKRRVKELELKRG